MDNIKKCTKCQEEKSFDQFYKDSDKKDKLSSNCKSCTKVSRDKYYKKNKSKILEQNKKYQKENAKKIAERKKEYSIKNKEKISKKKKIYRKKNKNQIASRMKIYYAENKERLNNNGVKRAAKRYQTDELFRLSSAIRSHCGRVSRLIKQEKPLSSNNYLGCSIDEFKAHIESQWQEGMTWDNHGFDGWHIDHITPLDWYIKNSDDPWQANHYTNLQPLWSKENLLKSNKIK